MEQLHQQKSKQEIGLHMLRVLYIAFYSTGNNEQNEREGGSSALSNVNTQQRKQHKQPWPS